MKHLLLTLSTCALWCICFHVTPAYCGSDGESVWCFSHGKLVDVLVVAQNTQEKAPGAKESEEDDYDEDEEYIEIADPLIQWNTGWTNFNDYLYFYVLKPVAQGYNVIFPEPLRVGIRNFFLNIFMPIRAVNCLLQGRPAGFATEIGRFAVNTTIGVFGFGDAGKELFGWEMQDEDFGQTLGVWGLGNGFYIVWPVFGPSTGRDTIGLVGDWLLNPLTYVEPTYLSWGLKSYERVNATSLRIGDYEAIKEAALDPYVAIRDAYVQYRHKKVQKRCCD